VELAHLLGYDIVWDSVRNREQVSMLMTLFITEAVISILNTSEQNRRAAVIASCHDLTSFKEMTCLACIRRALYWQGLAGVAASGLSEQKTERLPS
jgi:hypothetical protein